MYIEVLVTLTRTHTSFCVFVFADCLNSTIDYLACDPNPNWSSRVYNVASVSLSPRILEAELRKYIPKFEIVYTKGDFRQRIADSWPRSLDDSEARKDWGWKPVYGLEGKQQVLFMLFGICFDLRKLVDMTKAMLVEMRSVLHAAGLKTIDVQV
jgi:hypothetical protein